MSGILHNGNANVARLFAIAGVDPAALVDQAFDHFHRGLYALSAMYVFLAYSSVDPGEPPLPEQLNQWETAFRLLLDLSREPLTAHHAL